jgi:hypothetical protein
MSLEYQPFSTNDTISLRETDPVQCCLKGKSGIFNVETCPENPLRRDLWLCPAFMAQRCAESWDGYCDIYLQEKIGEDATGKAARAFIHDVADERFCKLDSSTPGSTCYKRCEMFNPTAPNSAQVCKTEGDIVYRDSTDLWNLDTNYSWSGKLSTATPIKFTACKKKCDTFTAENLTDSDRVINECLDTGACQDIMQNLAENIVSKGAKDQVKNKRLKQFIDAYILSAKTAPKVSSLGASPNLSTSPYAMPASDPYLPANNVYTVADIGNTANTPQLNVASTTNETAKKEAFRYLNNRRARRSMNTTSIVLTIVIISIVLYFLHKNKYVDFSFISSLF